MKPYMFVQSIYNELTRYTFNAFKLSGAGLDAYFLSHILNSNTSFFGKQSIQFKACAEILFTRSYEVSNPMTKANHGDQKKVPNRYMRLIVVHGHDLCDSICSKMKGSSRIFFYNVLNVFFFTKRRGDTTQQILMQ
ncbi:hypothetical protein RF11_12367 [Thelohanellus kitauei]|uniref:Uncharacterized protein n=1 Tax=Thelohanellus kitauei TaxID=669202 RepID=A0A0C2N986_THEKT|nr:hypothetical protein RF11_12367 [Thelohanellus kitauei]